MKIQQRKITDIKPYPNNPRKIPDKAINAVARSLEEFGFRQPIVVDDDDVIIIGHTRLQAAAKLGMTKVPVHVAEGMAPEKARALRLADNKTGELAKWDDDKLLAEVQALRDVDFADLDKLGFDVGLFDKTERAEPVSSSLPQETDVQPGDIYAIGDSRIICGSSLDASVRSAVLDGAAPHLCVTDPPYGVDYHPEWRNLGFDGKPSRTIGGKARAGSQEHERFNDVITPDTIKDAFGLPSLHVVYCWYPGLMEGDFVVMFGGQGFAARTILIWVKPTIIVGRGHFNWQHEPCLYLVRRNAPSHWTGSRKAATVINPEAFTTAHDADRKTGHPTQKPIECMARPIRYSSERGDWVWDPFAGSGTTILAAEQEGRRCAAVELHPLYVEAAIRSARDRGLDVERVNTGAK